MKLHSLFSVNNLCEDTDVSAAQNFTIYTLNNLATSMRSKIVKELGFDEECLAIYYKDDNPKKLLFSIAEKHSSNPEVAKHQSRDAIRDINFDKGWAIKAPLYQQAFRWFREKGYNNGIVPYYDYYYYHIKDFNNDKEYDTRTPVEATYKEAELACLKKLIEIVKNKENENNNQ